MQPIEKATFNSWEYYINFQHILVNLISADRFIECFGINITPRPIIL